MYAHRSHPSSHVSVAANCKFDFFDANNAVVGSIFFFRYGTAYKKIGHFITPLFANGVINIGGHSVTYTKIGKILFSDHF